MEFAFQETLAHVWDEINSFVCVVLWDAKMETGKFAVKLRKKEMQSSPARVKSSTGWCLYSTAQNSKAIYYPCHVHAKRGKFKFTLRTHRTGK